MHSEQFSCIKCIKCGELNFSGDMKHVSGVKCKVCGKLHETSSETYVAVSGNITLGMGEGLVGNNIENDIVTKVSIFCKGKCFQEVCGSALRDKDNILDSYDGSDYDGSNI